MSDVPTAAQSLYPDLPSAADTVPAPRPASTSGDAARSLYKNDGKTVAKPVDGVSALGGQARREGDPEPRQQQQQQAARNEPFNPTKIESLQAADPALLGEFTRAARELKLDHAGATRLVELHARAQKQADAQMEQQSQQWLAETMRMPKHELEAAKSLVRDASLTDPELRAWLETSPAGNWAPLVRTLANWARAMRRY